MGGSDCSDYSEEIGQGNVMITEGRYLDEAEKWPRWLGEGRERQGWFTCKDGMDWLRRNRTWLDRG